MGKRRIGCFLRYFSIFGSLNYYEVMLNSISQNTIVSSKILKYCVRIESSARFVSTIMTTKRVRHEDDTSEWNSHKSHFAVLQNKLPFPSWLFISTLRIINIRNRIRARKLFEAFLNMMHLPGLVSVRDCVCVCKNIMYNYTELENGEASQRVIRKLANP